MIEIQQYKPDCIQVWNQYVHNSKNGTFLFDRNYMDYHSERFQDFSLMIYRNSNGGIRGPSALLRKHRLFLLMLYKPLLLRPDIPFPNLQDNSDDTQRHGHDLMSQNNHTESYQ